MHPLSEQARFILERMEPDIRYESQELRGFVPDISVERLREIMHELWIHRQVERVEYSGWRRQRSAATNPPRSVSGQAEAVKPEELFDHATFEDFFK